MQPNVQVFPIKASGKGKGKDAPSLTAGALAVRQAFLTTYQTTDVDASQKTMAKRRGEKLLHLFRNNAQADVKLALNLKAQGGEPVEKGSYAYVTLSEENTIFRVWLDYAQAVADVLVADSIPMPGDKEAYGWRPRVDRVRDIAAQGRAVNKYRAALNDALAAVDPDDDKAVVEARNKAKAKVAQEEAQAEADKSDPAKRGARLMRSILKQMDGAPGADVKSIYDAGREMIRGAMLALREWRNALPADKEKTLADATDKAETKQAQSKAA